MIFGAASINSLPVLDPYAKIGALYPLNPRCRRGDPAQAMRTTLPLARSRTLPTDAGPSARPDTTSMPRSTVRCGMRLAVIALAALLVLPHAALAQTNLTWDANGAAAGTGGTGTWDTATALWFNGTAFVPWTNVAFDNAIFGGTAGTVTVTGTLTIHNITFNTAGYTLSAGTLTLGGTLPTIDMTVTATINSSITGTSGLSKTGTGTLVLGGANTYSGTTTIGGGTLQIGNGGTTGTLGTGAVVNNGALVVNRSNAITVSNAISSTGSVLLTGGGTLTLSGSNTYSGSTTVSSGILQTVNNGAGTGTVTLGDANTGASSVAWRIAGFSQPTNNLVVSNSGTGSVTLGGYSAGTFTTYGGGVQLGRDVTIQDATGDRTTFGGVISGTGNISISGTRVTFANN